MTTDEKLARMTSINQQLRRQLEQCRKDTVEVCAKFCEENEVMYSTRNSSELQVMPQDGRNYTHPGDAYAKGLRGLIGE